MPDSYDTIMAQECVNYYGRTPGWLRIELDKIERRIREHDSHELPRNSGEDAAVNGPTSLVGGDDAIADP